MPLTYDDIPGSWGFYSKDWPKLTLRTEDQANWAYIACSKGHVVPYGSYVKVGLELRVETEQMLKNLAAYLFITPFRDFESLKAHYISTGEWGR